MVAADGSSDDSDEGSINFDSFSTLGFLLHMDSVKDVEEQLSLYSEEKISMDSSIHDVY